MEYPTICFDQGSASLKSTVITWHAVAASLASRKVISCIMLKVSGQASGIDVTAVGAFIEILNKIAMDGSYLPEQNV